MKFARIPSPFSDIELWGSIKGNFTFVISKNLSSGKYTASVKSMDHSPFGEGREDLSEYDAHHSLQSAIQVCKDYYRRHSN